MIERKQFNMIGLGVAFLPLLLLLLMIGGMVFLFDGDLVGGASQIALLTSAMCCCFIGTINGSGNWENFEFVFSNQIKETAVPLVMLLLVGALSGSWMVSGVVPTFIYYGVELLHPSVFLVVCCVICGVVSLLTGSSWTTIATIGLALMGVGRALGFSDGWIAGSIISGAYFGDKLSPLSDTTLMSSSVSNTPLFTHIRYMLITTIPSFVITLLVFGIVGASWNHSGEMDLSVFQQNLSSRFVITPWILIVPLVTLLMVVRRLPTLIILFISMLLGSVFALIFQPILLTEIGAEVSGGATYDIFRGMIKTLYGATSLQMPTEELTALVATKGMYGMLNTVWLILCALTFGASMKAYGMLDRITESLTRIAKGRSMVVSTTVFSGFLMNVTTSDQYVSIMLTGNMFSDLYEKEGLESRLLSRSIEDGVTVTSVIVPWNSCSMAQSSVLGVSPLTFIPYCVFNYVSPIMSIVVASLGYKIVSITEKSKIEVVDF